MEKEDVIENETTKTYFLGIIGGIIGGLIGAIPWVLVYIYGQMIVALLAILIGMGVFYGYKIFRGKIGKLLPTIIIIITIAIIILCTLVICPMIMIVQYNGEMSLEIFKELYSNDTYIASVIRDLIISILFAIVGVSGIIKSISIQLKEGANLNEIKFNCDKLGEHTEDKINTYIEKIKPIMEQCNAIDRENSITEQEIIIELQNMYNMDKREGKMCLAYSMYTGKLKKYHRKYYYDENGRRNDITRRAKKITAVTIIIIFIIIITTTIILINNDEDTSNTYETVQSNNKLKDISINTIDGSCFKLNIKDEWEVFNKEEVSLYYDKIIYYDYAIVNYDILQNVYVYLIDEEISKQYSLEEFIILDRNDMFSYINDISEIQNETIKDFDFKTYNYIDEYEEINYFNKVYVTKIGEQYIMFTTEILDKDAKNVNEMINDML